MKAYNSKSTIRKPMNYGGMANITGNTMSAGMRRDTAKKKNMGMGMMGMKYGSKVKKK
jgi:hypothetical protein